jgi:hypothetical protein
MNMLHNYVHSKNLHFKFLDSLRDRGCQSIHKEVKNTTAEEIQMRSSSKKEHQSKR